MTRTLETFRFRFNAHIAFYDAFRVRFNNNNYFFCKFKYVLKGVNTIKSVNTIFF